MPVKLIPLVVLSDSDDWSLTVYPYADYYQVLLEDAPSSFFKGLVPEVPVDVPADYSVPITLSGIYLIELPELKTLLKRVIPHVDCLYVELKDEALYYQGGEDKPVPANLLGAHNATLTQYRTKTVLPKVLAAFD